MQKKPLISVRPYPADRMPGRSLLMLALCAATILAASCSGSATKRKHAAASEQTRAAQSRDWSAHPPVVLRNTGEEVIALGDVHGGYDRLVALLSRAGLIKPNPGASSGYSWSGGRRILICTGDLVDKGDRSIEVLDLMMGLQSEAPSSGGEVIVTLGNHEAEFLADPENHKATEFRKELESKGIDPDSLISGANPYGQWMMNLPIAARINDWFFAHGGNTQGETIDQISGYFRDAVDHGRWDSRFITGDDSILEDQKWWKGDGDSTALLDRYLKSAGAGHIVFGHDPGAFHDKGRIEQQYDGRIFLIDTGMSPAIDYSQGALMYINNNGGSETATSFDASGDKSVVWQGSAANGASR